MTQNFSLCSIIKKMEEITVEKRYADYIDALTSQVGDMLPDDVNKLQQDYLINNIKHSALLLASSLQSDDLFKSLDFEQHMTLIQIMAEWSFHKEIDLFRSGISPKYWKIVMQKIWYTMWEVMYACVKSKANENILLNLIERYVNRTYNEAIEELKETNLIDEITEEKAKKQSNIEIMAKQYRKILLIRKIFKFLSYIAVFALISVVVSYLVLKYNSAGIIAVLVFLVIYNIIR